MIRVLPKDELAGFHALDLEGLGHPAAYTPPTGGLVVLEEGADVLGVAGFHQDSSDLSRAILSIFKVSNHHRGQGVGAILMHAALAQARQAGYRHLTSHLMLWCPDYQSFYRTMGFDLSANGASRAL